MSGRRLRQREPLFTRWTMVVFLVVVIAFSAVMAQLFMSTEVSAFDLAAPFTDPLFTLPEKIDPETNIAGDARPAACPANTSFSDPLDLARAVDIALCNSPRLKAARAAVRLQAAEVGQARSAYLPTLSGNVNFMKTRHEYPGSNDQSTTRDGMTINATLNWRLFDFGGRAANRKSANSLLIAALALRDAETRKELAEVIQAYFDAVTSQAFLRSREEHETIAGHTLRTARRREARGVAARGDTLQATTALTRATLEKRRAQGEYRKAEAALVSIMGIPLRTRVILPEDAAEGGPLARKSLEEWLRITAESHPSILAARAEMEAAMNKITAARSEGLPAVDVSAAYYQNGYPGQGISSTDSRVATVALSISLPIFDGFSRTYKIRGAEALAERKNAELLETGQSTLLEIIKAHTDAETSLSNLDVSEQLLRIAMESLNVAQRRYEKGAADILEVLHTQAALADARQESIRWLALWRCARLRLMAATGVLGRDELKR